MINDDVMEAWDNRAAANINNIKTMTPSQLDRVKTIGSAAENLLKNRDFVLFVRQFQLESVDTLVEVKSHTTEDNNARIAIANQLGGIDNFISLLRRQVYLKDRVVTQQNNSAEPNS